MAESRLIPQSDWEKLQKRRGKYLAFIITYASTSRSRAPAVQASVIPWSEQPCESRDRKRCEDQT